MTISDPEACASFVAANRLIADRFVEKAERLIELAQTVDDFDERIRIADLVQFSEERAARHSHIATRQEQDLGVKCHCNFASEINDSHPIVVVVGEVLEFNPVQ